MFARDSGNCIPRGQFRGFPSLCSKFLTHDEQFFRTGGLNQPNTPHIIGSIRNPSVVIVLLRLARPDVRDGFRGRASYKYFSQRRRGSLPQSKTLVNGVFFAPTQAFGLA
jgi:hypothetical protein